MVAEGQQKVLYLQIAKLTHLSPEDYHGGLLFGGRDAPTEGAVVLSEELIVKEP